MFAAKEALNSDESGGAHQEKFREARGFDIKHPYSSGANRRSCTAMFLKGNIDGRIYYGVLND